MEDLLGLGKVSNNGLEMIKLVYPDVAQPAIKKVGHALGATTDFVTIPFKYLGLISQKADINIKKHLKDYQQKIDPYPEEQIGSVPPEIGVPIIEELTRVTNDQLASMYVNLLVNASLVDKSRYAHPSFLNVIKSLSADEAKIINHYKYNRDPLLVIAILKNNSLDGTLTDFGQIFINIDDHVDLQYKENKSFYFNNLEKLGILTADHNFPSFMEDVVASKSQEILNQREHFNKLIEDNDNLQELNAGYVLSDYGKEFIKSISVQES